MITERKNVAYIGAGLLPKLNKSVATAKSDALSKFMGLEIVISDFMPEDIVRVVHADGRIHIIKVEPSEFYA